MGGWHGKGGNDCRAKRQNLEMSSSHAVGIKEDSTETILVTKSRSVGFNKEPKNKGSQASKKKEGVYSKERYRQRGCSGRAEKNATEKDMRGTYGGATNNNNGGSLQPA